MGRRNRKTSRPSAPRSSAVEVQARIDRVAEIMARGEWSADVSQALAAEYGVAPSTIGTYATAASRLVWAASDEARAVLVADTIARLGSIAAQATQAAEFRSAVAALAERADVAGLKPRGGPAVTVQVQVGGERLAVPAHELVAQMTIVAEVLQRYPEAQAAVIAALRAGSAAAVLEAGVVVADADEGG